MDVDGGRLIGAAAGATLAAIITQNINVFIFGTIAAYLLMTITTPYLDRYYDE